MSKYEHVGNITFSPTATTDKEEIHNIYKKVKTTDNDSVLVVRVDYNDDTWECAADKTFEEIEQACEEGKDVVVLYREGHFIRHYTLEHLWTYNREATFISFDTSGNVHTLEIKADGYIRVGGYSLGDSLQSMEMLTNNNSNIVRAIIDINKRLSAIEKSSKTTTE